MYTVLILNGQYRVVPDDTEFSPEAQPEILYQHVPLVIDALTLVADHAKRVRRMRYTIAVFTERNVR